MKKILSILILFTVIIVLTGCKEKETKIYDCNAYLESDVINYNEECQLFKGLGFLNQRITYEVNLYSYSENEEIDWMEVLYQHKPFYDSLKHFSDLELISFDSSALEYTHGNTGSVTINYNDNKNQLQSKSFFVDIIDVTTLTNDLGDNYIPVIGELLIEKVNYTLKFDTFNDEYYGLTFINSLREIKIYEFIYRNTSIPLTNDISAIVTKSYLGYRVDLERTIDDETTLIDTYIVFSADNISTKDNPLVEKDDDGKISTTLNFDHDYIYNITNVHHERGTNYIIGDVIIYDGNTVIFETAFSLNLNGDNVEIMNEDFPYRINVERLGTDKLWISAYGLDDLIYYVYVLIID